MPAFEKIVIENNNPDMLLAVLIVVVAIYLITTLLRIDVQLKRKEKLEEMAEDIRTYIEENKNA